MLATVAGIHSGHPWPSPYGQRFALCKKAFLPFCQSPSLALALRAALCAVQKGFPAFLSIAILGPRPTGSALRYAKRLSCLFVNRGLWRYKLASSAD